MPPSNLKDKAVLDHQKELLGLEADRRAFEVRGWASIAERDRGRKLAERVMDEELEYIGQSLRNATK
jgi:hypothetical protein